MGGRARPAPVFGTGGEAGAHRAELDVAGAGKEMVLVHREGGEAAPPQAAEAFLAAVDVAGIAAVRPGERRAQAVRIAGDEEQADMVRHQAPRPDGGARRSRRLAEQAKVGPIIGVREEGGLPAIAALGDEVRDAGKDETRAAWHGFILMGRTLRFPYSSKRRMSILDDFYLHFGLYSSGAGPEAPCPADPKRIDRRAAPGRRVQLKDRK